MTYREDINYEKIKLIAIIMTSLILINVICILATPKYNILKGEKVFDVEWMIGKNSKEVEERYGKFDLGGIKDKDKDLYIDTACKYIIKSHNDSSGYLKITKYLVIVFDTNGIVYETKCVDY